MISQRYRQGFTAAEKTELWDIIEGERLRKARGNIRRNYEANALIGLCLGACGL